MKKKIYKWLKATALVLTGVVMVLISASSLTPQRNILLGAVDQAYRDQKRSDMMNMGAFENRVRTTRERRIIDSIAAGKMRTDVTLNELNALIASVDDVTWKTRLQALKKERFP